MVNSIQSSAIAGLQQAQNKMQRNASNIARANQVQEPKNTRDVTRSLVELNQNKNVAQASLKVLKTEDEMIGSLLDVKA